MGRVSPSNFRQNVLIETSNVCFKNFYISHLVLCHFLMPWSLENSKGINTFSITFSNNVLEDYVFWTFVYRLHCTKDEVFHYRFLQYMWPNPEETADLVTFPGETFNKKLHLFVQCLYSIWRPPYPVESFIFWSYIFLKIS